MKNMLKTVLIFTLILALSVSVFASTIGPQWDYLNKISTGLNINTSGVANATGSATLYNGDNVSIELNLQQLKSNGWTTIKTWTGSDTNSCTVSGYYAVYSGYDYRVEAIARIYDGNGNKLEEDKIYSPIKKY